MLCFKFHFYKLLHFLLHCRENKSMLCNSTFSVFPCVGCCRHWKDNDDSPEARRSFQAQNDQSSGVSCECVYKRRRTLTDF